MTRLQSLNHSTLSRRDECWRGRRGASGGKETPLIHPQTDLLLTTGCRAEQQEAEVHCDWLHAGKWACALHRKRTGLLRAHSVAEVQAFNTFATKPVIKSKKTKLLLFCTKFLLDEPRFWLLRNCRYSAQFYTTAILLLLLYLYCFLIE